MSALGHKRTFAPQNAMSALPPKADMCSAQGNVRFVPIADITVALDMSAFDPKRTLPKSDLAYRASTRSLKSAIAAKRAPSLFPGLSTKR